MKVLFIYTDMKSSVGYSSGIGVLSAMLKLHGHQTQLLHISDELGYGLDPLKVCSDIEAHKPGLICFSITTNQWHFARKIGQSIRERCNIPIMVGGHHPTADPDKVIAEPWVDILCRGEGEYVLCEVVKKLEASLPLGEIPNLIYKQDGNIVRQPLASWVQNLDDIPFDDYSIFDYTKIVQTRGGWAEVIVTRGCPYPCTYCFNRSLLNQYKQEVPLHDEKEEFNRHHFVSRRRSVDNTIRLLKDLKETYPGITGFTFVDDIMATEGQWFSDFAQRYREEISLPYACTSQPLLFNEKVAALLKSSGCKVVKMGIESGNEFVRKKVLGRNISNDYLVKVFKIATEHGLKPQAFNMIGLPGETIQNMQETIMLNAQIKPYIVWLSTFNPYPGTKLYFECIEKGMIDEQEWDHIDTYRDTSIMKEEYLNALEFKKLRVMFRWHLNKCLSNESQKIYEKNIGELSCLSDEKWSNGYIEKLFEERDHEIDLDLRKKDISHYTSKKYINILWGKEYGYDLS